MSLPASACRGLPRGCRALTSQSLNIHAGHDDLMGRRGLRLGHVLLAQLPGGGGPDRHRPTRCRGRRDAVVRGPGWVPDDHTIENVRLPEDELLKRFVGDPRVRSAICSTPRTVSCPRRPESGLIHEGPHRPARLVRQARRDHRACHGRMGCPHGAPVRPDPDVQDRRRDYVMVSMGTMADTALAVVDHLRAAGRKVGCITVTASALPGEAAGEGPGQRQGRGRRGAHGRACGRGQSADPRAQSALADAAMDGAACRVLCRPRPVLGSRDIQPGDLAAVFDWIADEKAVKERKHAVLGIRHPLALKRVTSTFAPAAPTACAPLVGGFARSPRTSSWRPRWRALQSVLQAYRATARRRRACHYVLPDHAEERSGLHNELTGRHVDSALRHQLLQAGRSARRSRDVARSARADAADRLGRDLGRSTAATRAEILARKIRLLALDTAALAMKYAPRADLESEWQASPWWASSSEVSPFSAPPSGPPRPTPRLMEAVASQSTRFFGMRGTSVVRLAISLPAVYPAAPRAYS